MSSFYKAFEDRFRGSRDLISGRLTVYLPLVEPIKAIYPDSLAIDLGCGRGEWLELLQRNGFKSHGVDTDEGMLENAAAFGLSTELRDALDYLRSLPDESVCIVSGFHIAEHLPFEVLQDLVKESLRVLKPAGILILETPNPENISVGSNSFYLDPTHVRPLPPMLLSFLPEYYGFSRVNVFRLNSSISEINNISLLNVINGASPDYSVIAQKNAAEEVLALFNDEFYKKHGFAVDELAAHYEKTSHGRQELENLLNTQVQREQAAAEKVEAVRLQVAHESAELARSLDETHNALNIKQAEQQQAFNQQLEAEKHERIAREQALLEQANQTKQEVEHLRHTQTQNEKFIIDQMDSARNDADQQSAALTRLLTEQQAVLHNQHTEREKTLTQQLEAEKQELKTREQTLLEKTNQTRQQLEDLLRSQSQREQAVAKQVEALRSQAKQEATELAKSLLEKQTLLHNQHTKREKALIQQLDSEKQERTLREQGMLDQTKQTHQQLDELLRSQVQREQEIAVQLDALRRQATQETTELAKTLTETRTLLHNQHVERERTLTQQFELEKQERVAREQALLEDANQTRQKLEDYLRNQVQREQVVKEKMEAALKLAVVESSEKERELVNKHTEKEQACSRELKAAQENLKQLQQDKAKREKEFSIQVDRGRQGLKDIFHKQAEREKEIATQLLNLQQQAAKEMAEVSSNALEQDRELARKQAEREQVHNQQLLKNFAELKRDLVDQSSKSKQGLKDILDAQVIRENNVAAQLLTFQQQAAHEKKEFLRIQKENEESLHRQYREKEHTLHQQLRTSRERLYDMEQLRLEREVKHTDQTTKTRQKLEANFQQQMLREQEIGLQLRTIGKQAAEEVASLKRSHVEHERQLHREHIEREQTLNLRLQATQEERFHLERDRAQREQSLSDQLLDLQQQAEREKAEQTHQHHQKEKTQQLQHAERQRALSEQYETAHNKEIVTLEIKAQASQQIRQLQAQLHEAELASKMDVHKRMFEACKETESQLKAEILSEQQTSLRLRQALTAVQKNLADTHASLTWRITTPLRALASLVVTKNPNDNLPLFFNDTCSSPSIVLNNSEVSTSDILKNFSVCQEPDIQDIIQVVNHVQAFKMDVEAPTGTMHMVEAQPISPQHVSIEPNMSTPAQPAKQPNPPRATTLDELLAYRDIQFVYCAYITILSRAPDSGGFEYYLNRLRKGISKMEIVTQLRLSSEGKTCATKLPGLDIAVQNQIRGQYPLIGWLLRTINGTEGNEPIERKLRSIENQLFLLSDESCRRFSDLDIALSSLNNLVARQTQSIAATQGDKPLFVPNAPITNPINAWESDSFKQLSPRAKAIYIQLKTVTATNTVRTE